MDVKSLIKQAYSASGCNSIRAFALRIGVSHTAVGKWLDGSQVPSFEQAAELAMLAGLPVVSTAEKGIKRSASGGWSAAAAKATVIRLLVRL